MGLRRGGGQEGAIRELSACLEAPARWCYLDPMSNFPWFNGAFLPAGIGLLAGFALAGCGGGGRPDTGYGANQSIPSTVNCADLCRRTVDCGGHLCAEDTGKDAYIEMFTGLESQCESSCISNAVTSKVTSTIWACLFKSSCREVFDDDTCDMQANYHCQ
jgi:hypothetical protein